MRIHGNKHGDLEDKLFKWFSFAWARRPYR